MNRHNNASLMEIAMFPLPNKLNKKNKSGLKQAKVTLFDFSSVELTVENPMSMPKAKRTYTDPIK